MIDLYLLALLLIPLFGGGMLAVFGSRPWAAELNSLMSGCTFAAAVALTVQVVDAGPQVVFNEQFFIDPFNVFLVALTAFVAFTTSLFSRPYMRIEQHHGKLSASMLHLYHSMYQMFTFAMLVALTTNNMGILWVAMEAATLTTVLLVSLYRTPASLEAAWKYFILCGVGIALALFGTILLYFAAEHVLGAGRHRLAVDAPERGQGRTWNRPCCRWPSSSCWSATAPRSAWCRCTAGCRTRTPKARRRCPPCSPACCSTSRCARWCAARCWWTARSATHFAGNLMMGFGLLSVVVAALFLSRQKDIKRMFAYSSIEHMGLITFAFGMGGPVATFAGLLHMTMHSLTKSAIFFAVGHAAQKAGTQQMEDIRGLLQVSPTVGWGLVLGTFAILGMPPFGVFASEFLIITTAMHELSVDHAHPAARAGHRLRRHLRQGAADGVRRNHRQASAASARADAGVRPPAAGADARSVHAALSGGLVPPGGGAIGINEYADQTSRSETAPSD